MKTLKKLNLTERGVLVDAAAGRIPVDTLIINVNIVNVFTSEIYPGVIGLSNGYIAYAFETDDPESYAANANAVYDGGGSYAVPGFIDSHVHIESSMLTPQYFAELVIPHGTTTIITDPHEIGNVLGIEGVEYMVEAGRGLPMYQLALAPSCVPSVPGFEEAGAEFGRKEIEYLLKNDRIIGIAEVMDYIGVVNNSSRMREILDLGFEKECFIQGHFFGNPRRELAAYLCAGPSSNHEIFDPESAKAAVRAGMIVDARDSSFSRDVEAIVGAVKEYGTLMNFTLCTDDREPAEILANGHINDCIRHAAASGLGEVQAIKAATINTAVLYGLSKLGAVAPGYIANINLVESLSSMQVKSVFFEGNLTAENRKMVQPIIKTEFPLEKINTVHVERLTKDTLCIRAPIREGKVRARVIHYQDMLTSITDEVIREVSVKDGIVTLDGNEDLNFIAVVNRHPGKNGITVALVSNFYLDRGALAGTISHDSHNLTLVFKDVPDAVRAAKRVRETGGGVVYVDGNSEYQLNLPVAGLMASVPAGICIGQVETLNKVLRTVGIESSNPVMRLATAALPVIPNIKITDLGLVDVNKVTFLDVILDV
ncbi:MAG: adenine deaminase [Spirochaetales bacterium]|nr:adenine deaminase [Spirochaetales bacterium]